MIKKIYLHCLVISLFGIHSIFGQETCSLNAKDLSYDVILVAGQSNTHYGYPLNVALDTVSSRVYSLYRSGAENYKINSATPTLDFWTRQTNRNSFVTNFSNLYVNEFLNENNRRVLIIPCGYAGSSIVSWSKNNNLYNDAISRVNYVLENIPGSKLVAILWHQGEANVGWAQYQTTLDKMIVDMRNDINQDNIGEVPFILGGMVPHWVNANNARIQQQQIIKNTPLRVVSTGYADPEYPTVITKPNNASDMIHFDAAGQRELGVRYFNVFKQMKSNSIIFVNTVEDLQESLSTASVSIYPNPVSDQMYINSNFKIKKVEVFDYSQNLLITNYFNANEVLVATDNLKMGIHIVLVTLENNEVQSIKITKK